jgi:septal ring factor EnvC (AmiA/AmiB activator)
VIALLALLCAQAPESRRLLAEVEAFDTQIQAITRELDGLGTRTEDAERAREGRQREADAARARVEAGRKRAAIALRSWYSLRRRGMARLLLDADDPVELRRRAHYLAAVIEGHRAQAQAWQALLAQADQAAKAAKDAAATVGSLRVELEGRRTALQGERARRVGLLREISGAPPLAVQAVRERDTAQQAFSAQVGTPEAGEGGSTAGFRALKGRMNRPVTGRLLRAWGPFVDPASGERASNLGIDWATSLGAPFRAVADGTVARCGYVRGYGQMVLVEHGSYATLYAHANGLRVAVGQTVRAGDVLGLAGNTGLTEDDDPRLHFEVRYNGSPQDPAEWLAPAAIR